MTKRILSIILALATVLSLCAAGFAAAEEWTTPPSESEPDEALFNPDAEKAKLPTSGRTGRNGTITWTVSGDTLTFTGTGEMGWPEDATSGEDWNSIYGYQNFEEEVTKIVVGEGITTLYYLGSYDVVKSLSLPSTLTEINGLPGSYKAPYSLYVPAGVTEIYDDLSNVNSVTVDPANTAYSAKDGVLYSKDGTTLIRVPGQRYGALTVPEGVKVIGEYSINYNVTSVTLPSTLTTIESGAIQASQTENLVIPASVTYIGSYAISSRGQNTVITVLNPNCELDRGAIEDYGTQTADHGWTSHVTIRGYAGSTAEQYAKDRNMKFEAIGGTPGATVTGGWSLQGGKYYYINADGSKAVGFISVGGQSYYMNADGVMQTGWIKVSEPYGEWWDEDTFQSGVHEYYYYARKDGSLVVHDWVKDGGKWYYMQSNGIMCQARSTDSNYGEPGYTYSGPGIAYVNGKYYAFDKNGAMYSNCWVKTVETEPIHADGHYDEELDKWVEGDLLGTNTYTTWYYAKKDGSLYSDEWAKIGGKWYWFSENGVMANSTERSYYDSEDKVLATNVYDSFVFDNGKWYYVDANGVMKTGWVELHGDYGRENFVAAEEGTELTDAQWEAIWKGVEEGGWYYFGKNGDMKIGWQQIGKTWYYLDPTSGLMQTGWQDIGGETYYLKSSGAMATGWVQDGENWYYAKSSGAIVKGDWQKVGKTWYYMGADGVMLTGMQDIDGATYYLKSSGAMATGWVQVGDAWYYAKSSGALVKGDWQKVGGTWYWFDADGVMAANTTAVVDPSGIEYTFDASGACLNP